MAFESRKAVAPGTPRVRRSANAAEGPQASVPSQPPVDPTVVESAVVEPTTVEPDARVRPRRPRRAAASTVPVETVDAAETAETAETAEAAPEPDVPLPRTPAPGGFASRASRPSGRRQAPSAPMAAAPSVDAPETLLRDDRIAVPSHDPLAVPSAARRPPESAESAAQDARIIADAHPTSAADDDPAQDTHEAVVVSWGGGRYAIEMDAVDEVGRPPTVTRVPGLPGWLAGVANWRGRILAVLDIRPLLSAPQAPLGRNARLVVCTRAGVTIGLLTESVEGVVTVSRAATETPLVTLSGPAAGLVAGHIGHPRGPIALLDLGALFALRTQLPRARRAG